MRYWRVVLSVSDDGLGDSGDGDYLSVAQIRDLIASHNRNVDAGVEIKVISVCGYGTREPKE